jgi:hypothetical protein
LHRHAERLGLIGRHIDLDGFEMLNQRLSGVPRRVAEFAVMLSPLKPEIGMADEASMPISGRRRHSPRRYRRTPVLAVVDQVHLVDRQHDVADADQVAR